jgi:hypothetical protein
MAERFGLEWRGAGAVRWLQWEGAGVAVAFPTRDGGVSPAPYASLNLGLSTDDEPGNVLENRRRLCAAVGLPQERLVVPGQVHGTALTWVGEADAGRGAFDRQTVVHDHDGLLTAASEVGLAVSYADCVPVVIAARGADGPELAAVHAGWRGMLAGIVGPAGGGGGGARAAPRGRRWRAAAACWALWSAPVSVPAASASTRGCAHASTSASRAPPATVLWTCGPAPAGTWRQPACLRRPSPSQLSVPRATRASSRTGAIAGRRAVIWPSPGGRKRETAPEVGA